jgi:hypothetical protein
MATYHEIQMYVHNKYKKSVKTCWIAHVKEMHGVKMRNAPNRISSTERVNPCPDWAKVMIEDAMGILEMMK